MSKIKPNEACPICGSGKKYKKCCADKNLAKDSSMFNSPMLEGTWGLAGTEIALSALRASSYTNNPMNYVRPGGRHGLYKILFILCKPSRAPLEENHFSFSDNTIGDSHVFINKSTDFRIEFNSNLPDGEFTFYGYPNENGFLSKIEIEEVTADSFKDATSKAYNALSPTLTRISLLIDAPVHIFQTLTTELSTQNYMLGVTLPYVAKTPPMFENYQLDGNFSQFASLYREALNSNSPNYQYLCFYKIIEGIRRILEKRTREENDKYLSQGKKPPSKPREIIPNIQIEQINWLNSVFTPQSWSQIALDQVFIREVTGRKINDLINPSKELDTVRNKIAHTVLRDETEETYNFDEGIHVGEVNKWLPLCKCLAIYLLKKVYPKLFPVLDR